MCFVEFAVQIVDDAPHVILVLFGNEVEKPLQREALVGAVLDFVPDGIVHDVELREEGAVGDVLEALRLEALALQKILHHLHAFDVLALVHQVHVVLPPFGEVFLRHLADGVGAVDDVVLAEALVAAVDGEVGAHHHAQHPPLLLVLDAVHLHRLLLGEGHEVGHHGGGIDEGDAQHPSVIAQRRVIYGNPVYLYYCHFCGFSEI